MLTRSFRGEGDHAKHGGGAGAMLKNIAPKGASRAVRSARRLRRAMTLPEVILWQALRKQPNRLKFRRQHPSGPYILDFFCSDARLAIEVDSEAHNRGDRPQRDEARDAWLRDAGIETLRIPAIEVLKDAGGIELVRGSLIPPRACSGRGTRRSLVEG